ncbi:MAG: COR domain-containing protein [Flammeovirgaceae bacterium]
MIIRWLYQHNEGLDDPKGLENTWQIVQEKKVEFLDISKNKFQKITFPDYPLPSLIVLDISGNGADIEELSIPAHIFPNLKYLYLKGSRISKFTITGIPPALNTLDLSDNVLDEFRLAIHTYPNLEVLKLKGNSIANISKQYWEVEGEFGNCFAALSAYLIELNKGEVINNQAKLIIVGNGRVGKTSMFKVLHGEKCNPKEPYTHGIRFGELEAAHFPQRFVAQLNQDDFKLSVWDFGGQHIFYALHQFFLSENSLYILAWTEEEHLKNYPSIPNQPQEDKFRSVEYWLENIRHIGKESPILVIHTHKDRKRNNNEGLKDTYNIQGKIDFSAVTESGLDDLQADIIKTLPQLESFGLPEPMTYQNVIQRIKRLKERKVYQITLAQFKHICHEEHIEAGNEEELLKRLHERGLLLYYADERYPILEDVIYIDPDWLVTRIYKLISEDLKASKGEFDMDDVANIFAENRVEQEQFLNLLLRFRLIFEESYESKAYYIAPQYLPETIEEKPREIRDAYGLTKTGLSLSFAMRFPQYIPDNVVVNFWSEYGPLSNKIYWKNGICFTKGNRRCLVLFKEYGHYEDCINELSVYTENQESDQHLLKEVFDEFVKLSGYADAQVSVDGLSFVDVDLLRKCHENQINKVESMDGSQLDTEIYSFLFTNEAFQVAQGIGEKEAISIRSLDALLMDGKFFELFQKMDLLFKEEADYRYNDFKNTITDVLVSGLNPSNKQVQGLRIFINSNTVKERIEQCS